MASRAMVSGSETAGASCRYSTSPFKSVTTAMAFSVWRSIPTPQAERGLNPSILEGRPLPFSGPFSPKSTIMRRSSRLSQMALTVVLLSESSRAMRARLMGCSSLILSKTSWRLIRLISSRLPTLRFISIPPISYPSRRCSRMRPGAAPVNLPFS